MSEIARPLGVPELDVRKALQRARGRELDVQIVGQAGDLNVDSVIDRPPPEPKPLRPQKKLAPHRVDRAAAAPAQPLFVLPLAPEAMISQARAITAETVQRNCMRCKTRFPTTRNGPRYCDHCRRYISSLG